MAQLIEWQVKAALIIALIIVVFVLFLAKDPMFNRNRFWLLSALFMPWIIPLLAMPFWIKSLLFSEDKTLQFATLTIQEGTIPIATVNETTGFEWSYVWMTLYALVSAVFLVRLLWGYFFILRLKRKSQKGKYKGLNLYLLEDETINPFSFYRSIFVPRSLMEQDNRNLILDHEKSHCQQWHSVDITLAEWMLILQWWNPFAWWLRKLIAQNHEFCVDKTMMQLSAEPRHYQYSLVNYLPSTQSLKLVNNFSQSLIKKRIMMMNNSTNNRFLTWIKGVTVMAVTVIALGAFANPEKTIEGKQEIKEINEDKDLSRFIAQHIVYPMEARENNFEGISDVHFKVGTNGQVNSMAFDKASKANEYKMDEVVVVAYSNPTMQGTASGMSNDLFNVEVEKVLEKLPPITNENLLGKTVNVKVKFVLQSKEDKSLVDTKQVIKNSIGDEFELSLKEDGFHLKGPKTNQPLFLLDQNEVTWSTIKKLDAGSIKAVGKSPAGSDHKGLLSDTKNGAFIIYSKGFQFPEPDQQLPPPTIYVDGKKYEGDLKAIAPDDIESINVLKGQGAVDKYGEDHKDGVIEITTKVNKAEVRVVGYGDQDELKKSGVEIAIRNKETGEKPIFFLGEKEVSESEVQKLNNKNIESITVLKDEQAIEEYGEKGKNGVVIIEMKK